MEKLHHVKRFSLGPWIKSVMTGHRKSPPRPLFLLWWFRGAGAGAERQVVWRSRARWWLRKHRRWSSAPPTHYQLSALLAAANWTTKTKSLHVLFITRTEEPQQTDALKTEGGGRRLGEQQQQQRAQKTAKFIVPWLLQRCADKKYGKAAWNSMNRLRNQMAGRCQRKLMEIAPSPTREPYCQSSKLPPQKKHRKKPWSLNSYYCVFYSHHIPSTNVG